jgi:hypothetical protein
LSRTKGSRIEEYETLLRPSFSVAPTGYHERCSI